MRNWKKLKNFNNLIGKEFRGTLLEDHEGLYRYSLRDVKGRFEITIRAEWIIVC